MKGIDLVYEILKKRRSCCKSYYALEIKYILFTMKEFSNTFENYIKSGYIDSFTDEKGRTVYAVGDVKPKSSLPKKNNKKAVPTFKGIKRF